VQYPGSARDVDPDERSCRLEASGRPNSTLVNEAGLTRHFSRLCVKAAVLDTLLSHAAFLKQTGDEPGLAERERELLQARLSLPPGGESVAPSCPCMRPRPLRCCAWRSFTTASWERPPG